MNILRNILVLIVINLCCVQTSYADNIKSINEWNDTIRHTNNTLPSLTEIHYQNVQNLDLNFQYELINYKKTLIKRSNLMMSMSFVATIGVIATFVLIGDECNWDIWVSVSCGTVAAMGTMFGFIYWRNHLIAKAEAVELNTIVEIPTSENTSISATVCRNKFDCSGSTYGLSFKKSF